MTEKILLVDDEPNVLASYTRDLRKRYQVMTALGGQEALSLLGSDGPFAVIVSDLAMPFMDGIQLLARIRELCPDTVRILITGHASLDSAIEAVNDGHVFRFLTKPCPTEMLVVAIEAGLEQYQLITTQRELHGLKKLKEAMEGIILSFVTVVEAKDPYTAGHQRRVTELCMALAEELGLEAERVAGLRMAAMVHDIGKVYVPAEFLNKPGRLTEVEFNVIKSHPVVGRDILASVDFAWPISRIVLQHHERLDGSGYPDGLSGEAILFEARIIAVADVVDPESPPK
ncbi:MAG: HD domain-containing phosphohydrolase [Thermodesulfobacteriota bacterium]